VAESRLRTLLRTWRFTSFQNLSQPMSSVPV